MARLVTLSLLAATAAAQTNVTIQWANITRPLKTVPAFQTVVNPFTSRASPIHDQVYASIAQLGAQYQRYVPWLPYPKMGIAELEPPSTGKLCGFVNSGGPGNVWTTTLDCGGRNLGTISQVTFASYGTPTGYCGSLAANPQCDAPGVAAKVSAACVGKASCTLSSNDETWGTSPCAGTRLAVEVTCSAATSSTVYTYWDFTQADQGMLDFLTAASSSTRTVIPNFSTIPSWLFVRADRDLYPDDPLGETWDYEGGGNTFKDPTLKDLGDYYGRLVAHYVEGGFTDEAGNFVPGYKLNISHWEVLNEIEGEHSMDPQTYTAVYDAIVAGVKRWAPTGSAAMKFVGLALENSGNAGYVSYFLNRSNHADPNVPLDFVSFHHYAGANQRDGGDAAGSDYTNSFFPSADAWLGQLAAIMAARDANSPSTMLDADEVGVILPDDNDGKYTSADPGFPNSYWNAAAASYVYLYGTTSVMGLDVLGESQLVGYPSTNMTRPAPVGQWTAPPQFPSVAMLNWTDGSGTGRYWALKLLVDEMVPGGPAGTAPPAQADVVVYTTATGSPSNTAGSSFCGDIINLANLSLACDDPGATINAIQFASYGTPTGTCGNYSLGSCNAPNSTAVVESYCLGRNACTVPATTAILGDPCYGTVKHLIVQATCTSGSGHQVGVPPPVYAQGYVEAGGAGQKKVLLVNKVGTPQQVNVPGAGASGSSTLKYVDPSTAFGPPATMTIPAGSDTFTLGPFSVALLRLA